MAVVLAIQVDLCERSAFSSSVLWQVNLNPIRIMQLGEIMQMD